MALKLLNIKYIECKCIRSYVGDPKDWENQEVEDIRDIDGRKIFSAYRDYTTCPECVDKESRNAS